MEEVLLRFPLLGQKICEHLDNQNLTTCTEVSRNWERFLKNEKFFWIRKVEKLINSTKTDLENLYEDLGSFFHNISCENVRQLFTSVGQFNRSFITVKNQTLMHFAAMKGVMKIASNIFNVKGIENNENGSGMTPLHYAARFGHLDICKLIIDKIVDKNPANQRGM